LSFGSQKAGFFPAIYRMLPSLVIIDFNILKEISFSLAKIGKMNMIDSSAFSIILHTFLDKKRLPILLITTGWFLLMGILK